jgi:uncharacterized protein YkwD
VYFVGDLFGLSLQKFKISFAIFYSPLVTSVWLRRSRARPLCLRGEGISMTFFISRYLVLIFFLVHFLFPYCAVSGAIEGNGMVAAKEVHEKSAGSGDRTGGDNSGGTSSTASEWIFAHNKWRDAVGTPHLTWSTELAGYAQEWADYLKSSNNCRSEHRGSVGKNYKNTGENLAWNWSSTDPATAYTPTQVVDSWGNEVKDYTYSSNSCLAGAQCGHYTQVVWSSTTQVGCGRAACGNSWIYVCEYYPPGNYVGQKPYLVGVTP